MTLRFDAPFWGILIAAAFATAFVTLIGIAARAAGLVG